ncbi:hypothetical protein [Saccharopolyspora pogona]|uniref:hypothetical protein n=1 Tax=Saccharopolyspora pogona TaxID=333966 RepID=UPI001688CF13|nr:hypothetical protein [Saccharopolyspora pogona]
MVVLLFVVLLDNFLSADNTDYARSVDKFLSNVRVNRRFIADALGDLHPATRDGPRTEVGAGPAFTASAGVRSRDHQPARCLISRAVSGKSP